MSASDPLLDRSAIEDAFRRLGSGWPGAVLLRIFTCLAVQRWRCLTMPAAQHVTSTLSFSRTAGCRSGGSTSRPASTSHRAETAPLAPRVFDHPGLRVSAASPEHLLAMKILAARRRDSDDIRFLVKHLGLTAVDEVLTLCAEVFPDEEVPARARLVLEDAFGVE